jgi:hypothetical protein
MQSTKTVRLDQDQLSSLKQACDSADVGLLQRLVETSQAKPPDLRASFWVAIDHNRSKMVRYLLEQGVEQVDAMLLRER